MYTLIPPSEAAMHIHHPASSDDTVSVRIEIPGNLATKLEQEAELRETTKDKLVSAILNEHFSSNIPGNVTRSKIESRTYKRKCVSIPAFIEINMPTNETQYKHVKITDISAGGIGFKMDSESSRLVDKIQRDVPFFILFCLPSVSGIVEVLCKPVYVSSNGSTHVGASFVKAPDMLKNTLQTQFGI